MVTDKSGAEKAMTMRISECRTVQNPPSFPRQINTVSFGIFIELMADFLEHGQCSDFAQKDIPVLRERVALALKRNDFPS